jgi:hypothetical protein
MVLELTMLILAALAIVAGIIGCFVPIIPGPIVAYSGLLCMIPTSKSPSVTMYAVFGVLTVVVTVLDYVVPAMGAKKFKCSKWGIWGCTIGTFIGIFYFPIGLLLGPFLGAFIGELIARKTLVMAAKGGLGALLGFLAGVFLKVVACAMMLTCYIMSLL